VLDVQEPLGRERSVLDVQEPLDADGAGGSAPSSHASLPAPAPLERQSSASSDKLRLAERRHPGGGSFQFLLDEPAEVAARPPAGADGGVRGSRFSLALERIPSSEECVSELSALPQFGAATRLGSGGGRDERSSWPDEVDDTVNTTGAPETRHRPAFMDDDTMRSATSGGFMDETVHCDGGTPQSETSARLRAVLIDDTVNVRDTSADRPSTVADGPSAVAGVLREGMLADLADLDLELVTLGIMVEPASVDAPPLLPVDAPSGKGAGAGTSRKGPDARESNELSGDAAPPAAPLT
jgi:hypothetical protein